MTAERLMASKEQTSGADENSIIPGAVTRRFVDLAQSMRGEPHDEGRDRLLKGQHSRTGTERIGARCATPRHRNLQRERRVLSQIVASAHTDRRAKGRGPVTTRTCDSAQEGTRSALPTH